MFSKLLRTALFISLMIPVFSVFSQRIPTEEEMKLQAPAVFRALFHTTQGDFTIEVLRAWSPQGADRLYQLLKTGFYDQNGIFRVQKGYVIQFGICDRPEVNSFWDKLPLKDEPAVVPNGKGTLSYARDGADSRTAQLFINLKDNVKLDTTTWKGVRGFTPVARIIEGYETVEHLYPDYGFEPTNHQDSVMVQGNAYWKKHFPNIDYILWAKLVE